ncbi:glycosyltransferase family 61 protein [Stagnihabitans tardus]|uniref:DUF563 domain-containing protein n=1 Tax=Stagnihabitans tardus TaxID=2699202 RepID=A0AAE4Y906_9RHOB|nr:glycosyltransferase family 61 protein [Stagnihabitans tardus]NBZ87414.1 DUF563 domain-containing protein [Stagnihabitans tardus]
MVEVVKKTRVLTDATQSPRPEGGWSHAIRTVKDAVIATSTLQDLVQPAGVFDAKGDFVHESVLWRGRALMVPPETMPEPVETLPGRWLWAGVLLNHFGHFLVESSGRLWGIDAVQGKLDGVIFISKRDADEEGEALELSAFHQGFMRLLGLDLPFKVVTQPTRVEVLEVPGQGFGIGALASGIAPFRQFIRSRFAKDIAPEGPEKLYISRSGLSAVRGGILHEERIEELLSPQGYEVFHPQKHPMEVQIARYKAAKQIVSLDGSALHLLAMVGREDQQVAMIKRRDSGASTSIVAHLTGFTGRAPEVIDVIKQDWVRSDRKKADRTSIGELDFARLAGELVARGFLPQGITAEALSPRQAERAIIQVEKDLRRRNLTFRPVPRGVDPATIPLPLRATLSRSEMKEAKRQRQAEEAPNPLNARRMERINRRSVKDAAE